MGLYAFLAALPGILGLTGFFAYIWVGQSRVGGDIFKKIVERLRQNPNVQVQDYASLTPARIAKLIQDDTAVRNAVNEQDRQLLQLLMILQHALTVIVLVVSAGLVVLSVWLVSRPQPLSIAANPPQAMAREAGGVLVDLDPVLAEWSASGKDEQVSVFLENVDSHQRSARHVVSSNVRSVVFQPPEVAQVATNRGYRQKNRIRTVIEWSEHMECSEPQDLLVGIDVELMLNGRVVGPTEDGRTFNGLFATIDHSSEHLPRDYCFEGDFVCVTTKGPTVVPLQSCVNNGEVQIPILADVNWAKPYGFVYNGPDDPRIVRTKVAGAPAPHQIATHLVRPADVAR